MTQSARGIPSKTGVQFFNKNLSTSLGHPMFPPATPVKCANTHYR